MPVFNAATTLEEAVQSVVAQTDASWELLLVNDGSTDGSAELIDELIEQYPGCAITVIQQENKGLGAARNAAIMQATGRYIALLDADDSWQEEKLAQCRQFIEATPECDVLYHKVETFGLRHARVRQAHAVNEMDDLLVRGNPIVPSACAVRAELLQEQLFSVEERFHGAEDLELWLRLLHEGAQFFYWPEVLGYYREAGGMSTRIKEHLRNVLEVLEEGYKRGYFYRLTVEKARQRKFYEAGRFFQKRGAHYEASYYFSLGDARSVKLSGLKILNALGIRY